MAEACGTNLAPANRNPSTRAAAPAAAMAARPAARAHPRSRRSPARWARCPLSVEDEDPDTGGLLVVPAGHQEGLDRPQVGGDVPIVACLPACREGSAE